MSEYVTVDAEPTANTDVMELTVNQTLTEEVEEVYDDPEMGEEGSTIAQTLFTAVDGIRALSIRPHLLVVTRDPQTDWEILIDDIRDALRDFFL